jgi:hypothetical protein
LNPNGAKGKPGTITLDRRNQLQLLYLLIQFPLLKPIIRHFGAPSLTKKVISANRLRHRQLNLGRFLHCRPV